MIYLLTKNSMSMTQMIDLLTKDLYVNDDDQDWGSAGMNNIQEDSE